jgi:hypothetical protein
MGLYRAGFVARWVRSIPLLISSMPAATACSRVLNFRRAFDRSA